MKICQCTNAHSQGMLSFTQSSNLSIADAIRMTLFEADENYC